MVVARARGVRFHMGYLRENEWSPETGAHFEAHAALGDIAEALGVHREGVGLYLNLLDKRGRGAFARLFGEDPTTPRDAGRGAPAIPAERDDEA